MKKVLLIVSILIGAFAIGIVLRFNYWQSNPDLAFEHFTGRAVPAGIKVTAYATEANDNILHFGHYFLLSGSPANLRQFTVGTTLKESTEDAQWMLPEVSNLFDRTWSREQVLVGYEDDSRRNNWYWVFSGESEALYVQN
jgi:hypothetical protein